MDKKSWDNRGFSFFVEKEDAFLRLYEDNGRKGDGFCRN